MANKTKEEIAAQMKREQKAKRLRAFIKEKFYPALIEASTSIDDAKFLLGSLSNMVMENFLAQMKEMKFVELNLAAKLDKKAKNFPQYAAMLALFANENVFETRELIEGMKNEVQMFIDDELKERKLDTLKTNFLE